jgi:putative membrane protein (TIGR04086 family)
VAVSDRSAPAAAGRFDRDALLSGIAVCLLLAIPLTLIAGFVDSDDGSVNALFFFGAAFGFVVGGGCAAWVQTRGTPLSHGVVTAVVAYAGAQGLFLVVRLARGEDVNWFGLFFTLSLVVLCGILGGILGSRLQARGITPSSRRSSS